LAVITNIEMSVQSLITVIVTNQKKFSATTPTVTQNTVNQPISE